MTTTDALRERHTALVELVDSIKDQELEPRHVIELCKTALNFSAFAQEVETNRLEQLRTMRQMCSNRIASSTKKLTLLLEYIETKIKT